MEIKKNTLHYRPMTIHESEYFKPDEDLRKFLEEYEATNGRMYQHFSRSEVGIENSQLPPLRPKYYGRKQTNSLRIKRIVSRLTQAKLAAQTGTTRRTIINIENGQRAPSVYLAVAIAEALEVPVEEIFHLSPLAPVKPSKY